MGIVREFDVASHLERTNWHGAGRMGHEAQFHKHDGRALFWRTAIPALLIFWTAVAYILSVI